MWDEGREKRDERAERNGEGRTQSSGIDLVVGFGRGRSRDTGASPRLQA